MHDLNNLVNITSSFHARTLSLPQFGQRKQALNYPNQQNGNTTQQQAQQSTAAPQQQAEDKPYALPETRQFAPENDHPVNRAKMSALADTARKFAADPRVAGGQA